MPDSDNLQSFCHEYLDDSPGRLALATTGTDSTHGNERLDAFDLGVSRAKQYKVGAGGGNNGTHVHYVLVRYVTVRKYTVIDVQFLDQFFKFFFSKNGNTFRVQFAGQFGRVFSAFDVRNLCRGKGDHFVIFIVPVIGIKIMEVSSGCTDNNYIFL